MLTLAANYLMKKSNTQVLHKPSRPRATPNKLRQNKGYPIIFKILKTSQNHKNSNLQIQTLFNSKNKNWIIYWKMTTIMTKIKILKKFQILITSLEMWISSVNFNQAAKLSIRTTNGYFQLLKLK